MLATRARGAALVVVASCMVQGHRNGKRPLSIGARPCYDVSAAISNAQPAFAWRSRKSATALAVSREEARHARLRRACRAAPVVVTSRTIQGHCTGERPLSIVARPWCDVPAAVPNAKPAFAWRARERVTALAVYQEEAQHVRLRRARAVPRFDPRANPNLLIDATGMHPYAGRPAIANLPPSGCLPVQIPRAACLGQDLGLRQSTMILTQWG